VEVSADEGKTWALAQLHFPVSDKALTYFSIPWQWDGKSTVILSRATDEHGRIQPERKVWKQKYASPTFNHYNAIQTWRIGGDGKVTNVFV
jgi:sulfane dehydrogenase subunit SoxC